MKRNSLLLLAVMLLFNLHVFSQNGDPHKLPSILPPSPNASELGKVGTIPINLSTGTISYNLPLTGVSIGALKLNVNLSYSGGGIKVDQIASRAGLGWTLDVGGMINRTVYGDPDEDSQVAPVPSEFLSNDTTTLKFLERATLNKDDHDTQPDIFSFNFNGYSGKFYLNPADKDEVIFVEKSNLRVATNFTAGYGVTRTITITDPNGIRYYFGGTGATEKSTSTTSGSGCGKTYDTGVQNTWYLTKIEDRNGDYINLSYLGTTFTYETSVSQTNLVRDAFTRTQTLYDASTSTTYYPAADSQTACIQSITNEGVYLDSIVTSGGQRLKFSYVSRSDISNGNEYLFSKIQYGLVGDTTLRTFDFVYEQVASASGYYSLSSDSQNGYRPFLIQVKEYEKGLADYKSHFFHYYSKELLPQRLAYAQDSYGFFNGANNMSFLPTPPLSYSSLFSYTSGDRSSNGSYANYGMLSKIIYPTGGADSILYAPHTYNQYTPAHNEPTAHLLELEGYGTSLRGTVDYTEDFTVDQDRAISINFNATYSGTGVNDTIHQGASLVITDLTASTDVYSEFLKIDESIVADSLYLTAGHSYHVTLTGEGRAGLGHVDFFYFYGSTLIPESNETIIVGGVRVAKVISHDPATNTDLVKSYNYGKVANPSLSSGALMRDPVNNFSGAKMKVAPSTNIWMLNNYILASSGGNNSLYGENGNHIAYENLMVSDGNGYENGGTLHSFQLLGDQPAYPVRGDRAPNMPYGITGKPSINEYYSMDFKLDDETKIKVRETFTSTKNVYIGEETGYLGRKNYDVNPLYIGLTDTEETPFDLASYTIKTYWNYIDSTKVISYDLDGLHPIVELTENFYDNGTHLQLTRTRTTDSEGRLVTKEFAYPHEMVSTSQDPTGVYADMVALHKISPVIEEKTLLPSSLLVSRTLTSYYEFSTDLILPQTVAAYNRISNSNETRLNFHRYDSRGNPQSISPQGGGQLCYIWSFGKQLPVAEIKNTDYGTLETTIGASTINTFANLANPSRATIDTFLATIKTAFPNTHIVAYSHERGIGIKSMTDAKGLVTYYEYDHFGRLQNIKDKDGNIVKNFSYHFAN